MIYLHVFLILLGALFMFLSDFLGKKNVLPAFHAKADDLKHTERVGQLAALTLLGIIMMLVNVVLFIRLL